MPCQRDINACLLIIDRLSKQQLTYAVYGAGKFTRTLLEAISSCTLPSPAYILDDQPQPNKAIADIPVYHATSPDICAVPYILLGTDTFQEQMTASIRTHITTPVTPVDIHNIPDNLNTNQNSLDHPINIYHCCGHKTASRWVQRLFSDASVEQYSDLKLLDYEATIYDGYDPRPVLERFFEEPFEPHRIISPMYISLTGFKSIPKPNVYRAFYVHRDPRDMINSLYFSMRYSHVPIGNIPSLRTELETMTKEEGIERMLHQWHESGYFDCLHQWFSEPLESNIKLVAFKDLTGKRQALTLDALFAYCGIPATIQEISEVLERHSFKSMSGRTTGQEDIHAHYRKGVTGDWCNHFTEKNVETYYALTNDLTEKMGYERIILEGHCPQCPGTTLDFKPKR